MIIQTDVKINGEYTTESHSIGWNGGGDGGCGFRKMIRQL